MSDSEVTNHIKPAENVASPGPVHALVAADTDIVELQQPVNDNEANKSAKPNPPAPFEHLKTPSQPSANGAEHVLNPISRSLSRQLSVYRPYSLS